MMEDGFVMLDNVVPASVSGADLTGLDGMPEEEWSSIADTVDGTGRVTYSGLRQHLAIGRVPKGGLAKKLKNVKEVVLARLLKEGMLSNGKKATHQVDDGEVRLLRTKPGCERQSFVHGDRAREHAMQGGGFDKMHYSVMVPLVSGGALWVKPYGKEKLIKKEVPRGSALCWRGDIGHGGDAYPGGGRKGQYRFFLQVNAGGRPIPKGDKAVLFSIEHRGWEGETHR